MVIKIASLVIDINLIFEKEFRSIYDYKYDSNVIDASINSTFEEYKTELINPRKEASTTSSAKSCHDMITGNSDFVTLSHRFPIELWDKAQEYYSNFGKKKSS